MRRLLTALVLLAACRPDTPLASGDVVTASAATLMPVADFWCYGDGIGQTCFYGDGALTQCQSDPAKPLDAF